MRSSIFRMNPALGTYHATRRMLGSGCNSREGGFPGDVAFERPSPQTSGIRRATPARGLRKAIPAMEDTQQQE
jgi:hypothetical protein